LTCVVALADQVAKRLKVTLRASSWPDPSLARLACSIWRRSGRIERKQQIAFGDLGAVLEMHERWWSRPAISARRWKSRDHPIGHRHRPARITFGLASSTETTRGRCGPGRWHCHPSTTIGCISRGGAMPIMPAKKY